MDSDSDSPFNYSWPSLPKMRIRRRASKQAQRHSTLDVLKKLKTPPTFFAAARLSTMLNGSDEVYANCMLVDQAEDLKMNYIHGDSISSDTCLNPTSSAPIAKSSSSPSLEENDQYRCDPNEGNQMSVKNEGNAALRPTVSPSDLYEADSYLPFKTNEFIKEQSQLHAVMKKKSSSLDDLEVNSRSEGVSDRSSIPNPLLEHREVKVCSRDRLDSSEMSISRTESLPLSISPQPKECAPSGIRSRSYSCSSPKDSLGRPRIPQDFTVGDSGEERAYSLPEHSREKRIQEEEWDKYIVPSKTESEKYKVSRTFSFLMNRMTSTRNKYKTKNKDTKDKQNRHNFISGTFSGIMPCMACEKALLGKESLQCSYCNVIVHKNCKECVPVCTKKSQERYHSKNKPQVGVGRKRVVLLISDTDKQDFMKKLSYLLTY